MFGVLADGGWKGLKVEKCKCRYSSRTRLLRHYYAEAMIFNVLFNSDKSFFVLWNALL